MNEADIKAGSTFSDASRRESHALRRQPFNGLGQVVDPQAHMVERRLMHGGLLVGIERLHQVDLDLERAATQAADVLVHILAFALVRARDLQAEHVDPELLQPALVRAADGDLLDAEHLERPGHDAKLPYANSTIGWSTTRLSPLPARTLSTTPSAAANSTFSIFIASITATRSPACTFWPGCTATSTSRPGIGEST